MKNIKIVRKVTLLIVALLLASTVLVACYSRPDIKENEWKMAKSIDSDLWEQTLYSRRSIVIAQSTLGAQTSTYDPDADLNLNYTHSSELRIMSINSIDVSQDQNISPNNLENAFEGVGKSGYGDNSLTGTSILYRISYEFLELQLSQDEKYYSVRYRQYTRIVYDYSTIRTPNNSLPLFEYDKSKARDFIKPNDRHNISSIDINDDIQIIWY
jgi:hypothetical protein